MSKSTINLRRSWTEKPLSWSGLNNQQFQVGLYSFNGLWLKEHVYIIRVRKLHYAIQDTSLEPLFFLNFLSMNISLSTYHLSWELAAVSVYLSERVNFLCLINIFVQYQYWDAKFCNKNLWKQEMFGFRARALQVFEEKSFKQCGQVLEMSMFFLQNSMHVLKTS